MSRPPVLPFHVLSRLPVIDAVRPHAGRGCEPIGHVIEGGDRSDIPDVTIIEACAAQALAIFLLDLPRRIRELDRKVKHGALSLVQPRGAIVHPIISPSTGSPSWRTALPCAVMQ